MLKTLFLLLYLISFSAICSAEKPLKVVLFSGHTTIPEKDGCTSDSGIKEFVFNDEIVKIIANSKEKDIEFIPVFATENIILEERMKKTVELEADIYVEIHHDSAQPEIIEKAKSCAQTRSTWVKLSGFSVFFSSENPEKELSKELAETLAKWMKAAGVLPNLYHALPVAGESKKIVDRSIGLYDNDFFVLKNNTIPAALVEIGVIVNPFEEAHLKKPETKNWVARAIKKAIREFAKKSKLTIQKNKRFPEDTDGKQVKTE